MGSPTEMGTLWTPGTCRGTELKKQHTPIQRVEGNMPKYPLLPVSYRKRVKIYFQSWGGTEEENIFNFNRKKNLKCCINLQCEESGVSKREIILITHTHTAGKRYHQRTTTRGGWYLQLISNVVRQLEQLLLSFCLAFWISGQKALRTPATPWLPHSLCLRPVIHT